MTPMVSVIIPIYNTAATLPRCIDSVLAQSFAGLEIVLVDDGTPDGAGHIADDYAARHENIIVVHQANAGLAEARRAGVRAASGRWIVHLDSDDTLPVNAVATLYHRATEHDLDIAYGCYERVTGQGRQVVTHRKVGIMSGNDFLAQVLDLGCICGSCGNISRRELWRDDVFPPGDLRLPSEDVFMQVMLSEHISRIGLFDDVVYHYYYNQQSLSIAGPLHRQELWRSYFTLIRKNLQRRNLLAEHEHRLRILEIDRLAFYTRTIDRSDKWYNDVVNYPDNNFPVKTRVLQMLLRRPRLLRWCVDANRRTKRFVKTIKPR